MLNVLIDFFPLQIIDYGPKFKRVLLSKLLAIMATKVEVEVIPLQDLHEVVEGVEAEDGQNSQEVIPLLIQNTGYSLSKALKLSSINPKYDSRFFSGNCISRKFVQNMGFKLGSNQLFFAHFLSILKFPIKNEF